MNQDQALSYLRTIITAVGAYAMGRGWVKEDTLTLVTGLAGPLISIGWGWYAHTDTAKLKAVEALSDVKEIVVKKTAVDGVADAAADPLRPKVTT